MIYTTTYYERSLADVRKMLGASGVLVDIRYTPWSKHEAWRTTKLRAALKDRYVWIRELGNEAYKERRIQLVDEALGVRLVHDLMTDLDADLFLMCGCPRRARCHRDTVAKAIHRRRGIEVPEWTPQRSLFS